MRLTKGFYKGQGIIPPFDGVRMIEYADHVALTPMYSCREFVGLGKIKASAVKTRRKHTFSGLFLKAMGDKELWVVVRWERYGDGREQPTLINLIDGTEAEARRAVRGMVDFCKMSKQELEEIGKCFKQKEEDIAYVKNRFPDEQPDPRSLEAYDVFQARLKVLAGMQPKTAALLQQAYATEDVRKRRKLEREAVAAFFAELSHSWTEKEVKAWQRSNPIGTEWISEFTETLRKPKRKLSPVDHTLALDWLRKGYNLLTEKELSKAVYTVTGKRLSPAAIKKRRERLGLTTKRPTGPRQKTEKKPKV
jgi:hypothetical protein